MKNSSKVLVAGILASAAFWMDAVADVRVDTALPAGCVKVRRIEGDTVKLSIDNRDSSEQWIYWAFRVTGAAGRTLVFSFDTCAAGSRGAAVSLDRGKTWRWSDDVQKDVKKDELGDHKSWKEFSWTFSADQNEVWFSQTIPYGLREWNAFLAQHANDLGRVFVTNTLCRSRKGRNVPYAIVGRRDGKAKERLFVTSRHHCQEATATYVVQGMIEAFCADDELGRWLRENVEMRVVPFVDFDGALDGDQGKRRKPWDHGRDYSDTRPCRYPETAAIMAMLKAWQPTAVQDTHCPWLRGKWTEKDNTNEYCYQTGGGIHEERMHAFGAIVEQVSAPRMGYRAADDFPFGRGWNANTNFTQGMTVKRWAYTSIPTVKLSTTFEIPFANQREKTLYPADFRAFGRDLMMAWRTYLLNIK